MPSAGNERPDILSGIVEQGPGADIPAIVDQHHHLRHRLLGHLPILAFLAVDVYCTPFRFTILGRIGGFLHGGHTRQMMHRNAIVAIAQAADVEPYLFFQFFLCGFVQTLGQHQFEDNRIPRQHPSGKRSALRMGRRLVRAQYRRLCRVVQIKFHAFGQVKVRIAYEDSLGPGQFQTQLPYRPAVRQTTPDARSRRTIVHRHAHRYAGRQTQQSGFRLFFHKRDFIQMMLYFLNRHRTYSLGISLTKRGRRAAEIYLGSQHGHHGQHAQNTCHNPFHFSLFYFTFFLCRPLAESSFHTQVVRPLLAAGGESLPLPALYPTHNPYESDPFSSRFSSESG